MNPSFELRIQSDVSLQFREGKISRFDRKYVTGGPRVPREAQGVRSNVGSDVKDHVTQSNQLLKRSDGRLLERTQQVGSEVYPFAQVRVPFESTAAHDCMIVLADEKSAGRQGLVGNRGECYLSLGRQNHIQPVISA